MLQNSPVKNAIHLASLHLQHAVKPLIVVLGPTASGKTELAIELALELRHHPVQSWSDAEIVNADSRQLYRYLDIGTAKVTETEKRGVIHHLFDVLDPKQDVTAAWYQKEATNVITEILDRKHVPILVGGSMLYISAVVDGLSFAGKSDPEVRSRLEREYDLDHGKALHQRLSTLDPEAAENIPLENKPYVLRAVEIAEAAGSVNARKKKNPSPYDVFMLGLRWPRSALCKRIDQRTTKMLESGWIEEVKLLIARGYGPKDPGMISHGYREILQWISEGKTDRSALAGGIAAKTRQYAKRQVTWWKRDERIHWLDMDVTPRLRSA